MAKNCQKKTLVIRKKAEEDKRRVTVLLTESGQELIARVFPRHAEVVTKAFAFLRDEEKKSLSDVLRKFK